MATKIAKVLDNGRKVVVDMTRERTAQYNAHVSGANRKLLSKRMALSSPINKVVKKMKLDGSCGSQVKTSLLKCYSNFTKSGAPQRVMYYQNGEWINFSHELITFIKKDLQVKKAAMEVEYNGQSCILDFLHMVKVDSITGYSQPMAWIDEAGKCFFPETFSGFNGQQDGCFRDLERGQDIRLQLEIELKNSDLLKFNGCSGDSNAIVKQIHVADKLAGGHSVLEVADSCEKPSGFAEAREREKNDVPSYDCEELDSDDVKNMFFIGMGSSVSADVVDIYRGSSSLMQARMELFYKQVEIVKKFRGDANVRYAWFPTTKEALPSIMTYGLGHIDIDSFKSTYGVGVHLSPANSTYNSASYCDIDENGIRHMVLCRIIMGKMEHVCEGSKQFYPSGEDFDSGVDDLKNPTHYIIWNMNKNTHIYPEYAVSFKVFSDATGFLAKSASKLDISGVTDCSPEPSIHSHLDSSPAQFVPVEKVQEKVLSFGSSTPRSPWVAFPTLLAAVAHNVPPREMKLLQSDYELLRSKKINRQDFIRKLRLVVGDTLLRSAITDLQSKEKGDNELKRMAGKVEFRENMANESKQVFGDVEVAVDKVMPNFEKNCLLNN